ncbi:MAG: hypothetical protein AAF821_00450 [Cyanobacteria bacterium P01_D01_bin.156]
MGSKLAKSLLGAFVGIAALAPSVGASPFMDNAIDNYVGAGVRSGLNDSTALVLDSKFEVIQFEQNSLSVRPAVLIGDQFEGRFPVSFDLPFDEQFLVFGGGGFAYNFDESDLDPMITAGLDMSLTERLVLNVEGNLILKSDDTDAEIAGSINWQF